MMLLLNTIKLVLIALNIIPNRIRHKKVMFFIYMGTLVTHGKSQLPLLLFPPSVQSRVSDSSGGGGSRNLREVINYNWRWKRSELKKWNKERVGESRKVNEKNWKNAAGKLADNQHLIVERMMKILRFVYFFNHYNMENEWFQWWMKQWNIFSSIFFSHTILRHRNAMWWKIEKWLREKLFHSLNFLTPHFLFGLN